MKSLRIFVLFAALFLSLGAASASAAPQTTAFTYQGRLLQNGSPTNGNHDLVFTLWDSASGGIKVGSTIAQGSFPVANGLFTIDLDFGANAFAGGQRYLEVQVDGNKLVPRQPVNTSPVAQYALSGPGGLSVSATISSNQFSNDHLYTGIGVGGKGLTMVMIASPAFNPGGESLQPGYANGVNVYNVTSQIQNTLTLSGIITGGGVGKAISGDVRVLAAIDAAYKDLASRVFAGGHYNNLQIDVLQPVTNKVLQSFCHGFVFVTSLQPMPQPGMVEITFVSGQTGHRLAQLDSSGTVTGYVEGGWNFVTNTSLAAAPCVNPPPT